MSFCYSLDRPCENILETAISNETTDNRRMYHEPDLMPDLYGEPNEKSDCLADPRLRFHRCSLPSYSLANNN